MIFSLMFQQHYGWMPLVQMYLPSMMLLLVFLVANLLFSYSLVLWQIILTFIFLVAKYFLVSGIMHFTSSVHALFLARFPVIVAATTTFSALIRPLDVFIFHGMLWIFIPLFWCHISIIHEQIAYLHFLKAISLYSYMRRNDSFSYLLLPFLVRVKL